MKLKNLFKFRVLGKERVWRNLYKKILVATDGSENIEQAIKTTMLKHFKTFKLEITTTV